MSCVVKMQGTASNRQTAVWAAYSVSWYVQNRLHMSAFKKIFSETLMISNKIIKGPISLKGGCDRECQLLNL